VDKKHNFLRIGLLCATIFLTACGNLPRGAGLQNEVLKVKQDEEYIADSFAVAEVTRAMLPVYAEWPRVNDYHYSWIKRQKQPANRIIAPGDTVSVVIWANEENGLLTSGAERSVAMPDLRVSSGGRIFLPYIDEVKISGMSPEHAREVIQEKYETVTPAAQVQLSLVEGRAREVSLVGGVGSPGTFPLPDQDYTVLSLLSAGGGVDDGLENPQIRLHRSGKIYGTSVSRLYDTPSLDTTLRGGDKVIVQGDSRYFLSLGATGTEARHVFPKDHLTAIEAMSIIGGVSDSRADPKGILVVRQFAAKDVDPLKAVPPIARMVFTIDLTTADGLFSAGQFRIQPGDLVYGTESPVTQARTIFGLIGSAFGVVNTAAAL
jgi:polysaccharide export outer membrane protein